MDLARDTMSMDVALAAVADRAGVSVHTLLRHFGNKDGLLDAVQAFAESEVIEERAAPTGEVEAAVRTLLDHYERAGDWTMAMLAEERLNPASCTSSLRSSDPRRPDMADILFVTWDGGGNVPPALGIAAELRRRNHVVRFLGHAQQRDTIAAAGFGFTPYTHARPWSSTEPSVGPTGAAKVFSMFTDRGPGGDLLAAIEREPADLVVLDCMCLGALHAAERASLRRAVLVHTYWRYLTHSWSRGPIGLVARLKGQNPMRLWTSADIVLVATDRDLDPAHDSDLPPALRHVGVVQPQPTPATIDVGAPPRVLVSLSTVNYPGQEKALRSIIAALAGLPVHAVVTTGPAVDPSTLDAPSQIELYRHLPHAEVMPGVGMVIGHGGHATTMRALAHDLPLIVMPMHPMLDQKMIGNSVEAHGAAVVLPRTASVDQIRAAVQRLLPPGPHSEAAARLGSRLRAQNGAVVAANHLCALLPAPSDVHTTVPSQPGGPS